MTRSTPGAVLYKPRRIIGPRGPWELDGDVVPNETSRVRSGPNQGNVRAADYQPLREQLWRRGQAAKPHRRETGRARFCQRSWLPDQWPQARTAYSHELDDPS